jgi:hypothetical protein
MNSDCVPSQKNFTKSQQINRLENELKIQTVFEDYSINYRGNANKPRSLYTVNNPTK